LASKRPDLRIDRAHGGAPDPVLRSDVVEQHIDGFRLEETVLFYRPANTLIVADLVHNIGRPKHGWTAFYTRSMGFYDRIALSRMIRWAGFANRSAARSSIEGLLSQSFDRLVMGHGAPVGDGGREALAGAYAWLGVATTG
jgi:hypothetical protein